MAAVIALAAASAGCGSTDPGATLDPGCQAAEGPMLPWTVGNTWTYLVNDEGIVGMKETTIGALEVVGGTGPHNDVMANKVVTRKGAMDQTVSWQGPWAIT